jgi:hypothetical protein
MVKIIKTINCDKIIEFNDNKIIDSYKIIVNVEHTLVKQSMNTILNVPKGKILSKNNDYYYVRIDDIDKINNYDLIKIHQHDDYNTCEELRILPALLSNVIVISEVSPLIEYIPYKDHIIWFEF